MDPAIVAAYQAEGRTRRPAFNEGLARRLQLDRVLHGHAGCVNRMAWNADGSLLASASDDLRVIVWHPHDAARVPTALETQHRANLFGVQFLPGSSDATLISGAMDCTVQLHRLDAPPATTAPAWRSTGISSQNGTQAGGPLRRAASEAASRVRTVRPRTAVYSCHEGRVKDVRTAPGEPHLFWSASEDGTVRQFDTRVPTAQQATPSAPNVLMRVAPAGDVAPGRRVEVKGLDVSPADANLMAVACGDPFVRLYDRRRLSVGSISSAAANSSKEVLALAPPHLPVGLYGRRSSRAHSTCVSFSSRGDRVVSLYHSDHAYCFDVTGAASAPKGAYYQPPGPTQRRRRAGAEQQQPHLNGWGACTAAGAASCSDGSGSGAGASEDEQLPMAAENAKLDGSAALFESHYSEAVDAFTRALYYAPWSPGLYTQRALALLRRRWEGDAAAALRDCDTAESLAAAARASSGGAARQAVLRRAQALRLMGQLCCARAACDDYVARWPAEASNPDFRKILESIDSSLSERRRRLKAQAAELRRLSALRRSQQQAAKRRRATESSGAPNGVGVSDGGTAPMQAGAPPPPPPMQPQQQQTQSEQQPQSEQQQQQQNEDAQPPSQQSRRRRRGPAAFAPDPTSTGDDDQPHSGGGGSSSSDEDRRRGGSSSDEEDGVGGGNGGGGGSSESRLGSDEEADWEVEALLPWYGPSCYPWDQAAHTAADDDCINSGSDGERRSGSGDGESSSGSEKEDEPAAKGGVAAAASTAAARCRARRLARLRTRAAAALAADAQPPRPGAGPGRVWDATPGGRRMLVRCIGSSNMQTDIKEAVFVGRDDRLVACGSDDGRVWIFDAETGAPVKVLPADDDVANCVRAHPTDALLATSGILKTIKLWSPTGPLEVDDERLASLAAGNQDSARGGGGGGVRMLRGLSSGLVQAALAEHPELLQMLLRGAAVPAAGGPAGGGGGDEDAAGDEDGLPQEVACRVA